MSKSFHSVNEARESRPKVNIHELPLSSAARLPSKHSPTPLPQYQKPHQLISFSYSPTRELLFDDSALNYYVDPPENADLSYRMDHWNRRPEEKSRLDGLLEACLKKEVKAERKRADVITWRGVLTKIFTAPYEQRDGWHLNVMFVNDTIYLEEHLTDEQIEQKNDMQPDHARMSYYGYAFESFCTKPSPDEPGGPDGWSGDVNTNVQWCSVIKSKLRDLRIIIGGEVDCVKDVYTGEPDTFVELKTSQEIRPGYKHDRKKFELKLLKFFAQSFLLGVPDIVVGFRSPDGHLKQVTPFKTATLPKLVRDSTRQWDARICQVWLDEILHFLKHTLSSTDDGDESDVWRLSFEPSFGARLYMLDHGIVEEEITAAEDRVGFLPRWYWEVVKKI